jgi:hypothetical protein
MPSSSETELSRGYRERRLIISGTVLVIKKLNAQRVAVGCSD